MMQANLNHARGAQNLFVHTMAERNCGLGVVAEPYRIPDNWVRSTNDLAAITRRNASTSPPLELLEAGEGYVMIQWGPIIVASVYLSPSLDRADYGRRICALERQIAKRHPAPIIVAGDFNAKSRFWGSPRDDWRGGEILEWAATCGLALINTGSEKTCVRMRGGSIIDLTWATRPAQRVIHGWRVATEAETLSDHRYIEFSVAAFPREVLERRRLRETASRRWALRKMDQDAFLSTIEAVLLAEGEEDKGDLEQHRAWLRKTMIKACDAAMPRVRSRCPRKAYWWSEDIAKLRRASNHARRQVRCRKRFAQLDPEGYEDAWYVYRHRRDALRVQIRKAKAEAWKELLSSLDADPWGSLYRMVMNKLRGGTTPITKSLDPQFIDRVIGALFPLQEELNPIPEWEWEWDKEVMGVSGEELKDAIRKIKSGKAPGPDSIHGRAWALAYRGLGKPMRRMYTECFRMGIFPREWKEAHVVLLPKQGKPRESPSAYRPICLLDEVGKILERIIATRFVYHLSREGPNLNEEQYGFRVGRSTIDAVLKVRSIVEATTREGGVLLAVSLDISNAFNTLPWSRVEEALLYHRVPPYLVSILREYFRDRELAYADRNAEVQRRRMSCGVPQGSVLGPLMWNLAYDVVLRTALPSGCQAVCYADDTLVLAGRGALGKKQLREPI